MAKQKTFTLAEAQTLVPVLRSLIKRAMDDKGVIETVEKELLDLKHRILLAGGLFVDIPAVARTDQVVATAEAAWPGLKLALLREDEFEFRSGFEKMGWRAVPLAEADADDRFEHTIERV